MSEQKSNFSQQQQQAIERMWEMQQRSKINDAPHTMPPVPPFVRLQNDTKRKEADTVTETEPPKNKNNTPDEKVVKIRKNESGFPFSGLRLPFFKNSGFDGDMTLIIGLLLLLANEKADRKLLLALLYILM